jgi:peptidoglycan/LPS O-acetylase OafA/YrhL
MPVADGRARAYFGPLTGFRAIAAGLVVLFHYVAAVKVFQGAELPWLTWLLGNGQNGVTIFFALSGFLITIRYRDALRDRSIRLRQYWLRRFARIYPSYFVSMALLSALPQVVFDGSTAYNSPWVLLGLLFMAQAFFLPIFPLGVPIGWTLTLEEIFYAVAIPLGRTLSGSIGWLFAVATVCLTAMTAIFVVIVAFPALYAFSGFNPALIHTVSFFVRFGEFLAGAVAGILFLDHAHRVARQAQLLIATGFVIGVSGLFASNHFTLLEDWAAMAGFRFVGAVGMSMLMLGCTLNGPDSRVNKLLGGPTLDYLGKTSYALYLIHLTWPMEKFWAWLTGAVPVHPLALAPLMYVVCVAASFMLYELVERPAHAYLTGEGSRKSSAT